MFTDYNEEHYGHFKKLDNGRHTLLAKMWERNIPRTAKFSILEKYLVALDLADRPSLDKGQEAFQNVNSLIRLRNALIHYEPESVLIYSTSTISQKDQHKLEQDLKGNFKENPLTGKGNPFYPDKCLGHGCAEWGVISCLSFSDEFFSKLGIEPIYKNVRPLLDTQ